MKIKIRLTKSEMAFYRVLKQTKAALDKRFQEPGAMVAATGVDEYEVIVSRVKSFRHSGMTRAGIAAGTLDKYGNSLLRFGSR